MANQKETRTIKIIEDVKGVTGKLYKFQKIDEKTGDPVVRKEDLKMPEGQQRAEMENGNSVRLLEGIVGNIPAWAFWQKDSGHQARIFSAINDLKKNAKEITLKTTDYEWLFGSGDSSTVGLLDRKMGRAQREEVKIDEENEQSHPTVGMVQWGQNEHHFRTTYFKYENED